MCAGKTTVGKALAQQLGCMFYDLDWYIEHRFRRKITDMFAQEGEDYFRKKEQSMLHEVAEFENVVVSCGGGTPCYFDNIDYMNQVAEVIYLKASPEIIIEHLKISKGRRPLLEGMDEPQRNAYIRQQLAQRTPHYMKAKHIIDIDILTSFEKINLVVQKIKDTLQQQTKPTEKQLNT